MYGKCELEQEFEEFKTTIEEGAVKENIEDAVNINVDLVNWALRN